MHLLANCNLKIVIKYKLVHQKSINCVGVETFEHSELKFKNVRTLKLTFVYALDLIHIKFCDKLTNPFKIMCDFQNFIN